jgi:hypothetical protein
MIGKPSGITPPQLPPESKPVKKAAQKDDDKTFEKPNPKALHTFKHMKMTNEQWNMFMKMLAQSVSLQIKHDTARSIKNLQKIRQQEKESAS